MSNDEKKIHTSGLEGLSLLMEGLTDEQLRDVAAQRAADSGVSPKVVAPAEKGRIKLKLPEAIGHLLARLYAFHAKQRADHKDSLGKIQDAADKLVELLPEPLFHQLQSYCVQNSTTFLPYEMIVHLAVQKRFEREGAGYANPLEFSISSLEAVATRIGKQDRSGKHAQELLKNLGEMMFNMQNIMNNYGFTIDDIKMQNRLDVDKAKDLD